MVGLVHCAVAGVQGEQEGAAVAVMMKGLEVVPDGNWPTAAQVAARLQAAKTGWDVRSLAGVAKRLEPGAAGNQAVAAAAVPPAELAAVAGLLKWIPPLTLGQQTPAAVVVDARAAVLNDPAGCL